MVICETYSVYWYSRDLWSIGGYGPWYKCILLYVILIWCGGIPEIYGHLEGGGSEFSWCSGVPQIHDHLGGQVV